MRFIVIAVILTELSVYGTVAGVPGSVDHQHKSAYEVPAMPIDPDDDEDEDRVRPRRAVLDKAGGCAVS